MRKTALLAITLLFSAHSFAGKLSDSTSALSAAWKSYHSLHAKHGSNEIDMVYGGADVSSRSIVDQASAIA